MPVRGLQRHVARVDIVLLKAMLQPAGPTCPSRRQQPAVALQGVEHFQNAVEQRLLDAPRGAKPPKGLLVILGQLQVLLGGTSGSSAAMASVRLRLMILRAASGGWNVQPVLRQAFRKRRVDRSAAVDERSVATEDGEAVHLPPFASSMAPTMSSRPARRCPSTDAANCSSGLCWPNLRVPRIASGCISKPTIARVMASNRPAPFCARPWPFRRVTALHHVAERIEQLDQFVLPRTRADPRFPPLRNARSAPGRPTVPVRTVIGLSAGDALTNTRPPAT